MLIPWILAWLGTDRERHLSTWRLETLDIAVNFSG